MTGTKEWAHWTDNGGVKPRIWRKCSSVAACAWFFVSIGSSDGRNEELKMSKNCQTIINDIYQIKIKWYQKKNNYMYMWSIKSVYLFLSYDPKQVVCR